MVKKFFALASVTALTGLVSAVTAAGCSDSESGAATGDAGDGGRRDARPVEQEDAGEQGTGPACMLKEKVPHTQIPYQPPVIRPGACTLEDLAAYVKFNDDNPTARVAQEYAFLKGRGQACADCIYSQQLGDAGTWTPLLANKAPTDSTAVLSNINVGGCVEIASGNHECGKALQQSFFCQFVACQECDDNDFEACRDVVFATGNPCNEAAKAVGTACGAGLQGYLDACEDINDTYIFEGPIRAQCIRGGSDGGTDAGDGGADGGTDAGDGG